MLKPMEDMTVTKTCTNSKPTSSSSSLERKIRSKKVQALNCPRCNSSNTKFCYYNNYSLTQPRYFCKNCKRYWTQGGSLRNIPVGGFSRKNRASSMHSNSSSSRNLPNPQNPRIDHDSNQTHVVNLGFNKPMNYEFKSFSEFIQPSPNSSHDHSLELLSGFKSKGLNSFLPNINDSNADYSSGFQNLSFNFDGYGSYGVQENPSGKILFPFEDLKVQYPSSTTNELELNNNHNKSNGDPNGYWNGMMGGGWQL
jgi:hypothetical protein